MKKRQRKKAENNELGLVTKLLKIEPVTHTTSAPVYGFLFRKMSMLTCSGVRRDRSLVTISPAAENTRSEGADVAVMHKYLRANLARRGNNFPPACRGAIQGLRKFFISASMPTSP